MLLLEVVLMELLIPSNHQEKGSNYLPFDYPKMCVPQKALIPLSVGHTFLLTLVEAGEVN